MKNFKFFKNKKLIFDLFFVSFLCSVVLIFFLFFYRKSEYVSIRVKVTDQDVLYEYNYPNQVYTSFFVEGDVEKDAAGRVISKVENVTTFLQGENSIVYLDLLVKATYDSRADAYSFKGKKIVYGSPMRFNLGQVTFDGYVTYFPGLESKIEEVWIEVQFLSREVDPQIIEILDNNFKTGGIKMLLNNELIAELFEYQSFAAEESVPNDRGQLVYARDPFYKDLYMKVKFKSKKINSNYVVFDSLLLQKGKKLDVLTFSNFFIDEVLILDIFELEE